MHAVGEHNTSGIKSFKVLHALQQLGDWRVLDVATGAGHTAFTFAPHVKVVHATDITPQMLAVTTEQAQTRGLSNIVVEHADAEALPYEDGRFDLVTCRIAPHHFGDVPSS